MIQVVIALALVVEVSDDHLGPVHVTIPAYERTIRRALLDGTGRERLEMVEMPSFEPEQAMSIVETEGAYEVRAARAAVNLWYGRSADESPARPPFATNHGSVTRKESPSAPIRCAGPVSSATFDKVRRVWLAAFAAARSSDRLGLDGTTYRFGLFDPGQPPRTASTWSPGVEMPKVNALVGLGYALIFLACVEPGGRAHAEGDVSAVADALLAALESGARREPH